MISALFVAHVDLLAPYPLQLVGVLLRIKLIHLVNDGIMA
jgi:hypothetical protein